MNKFDLFRAIGNVDDKYLLEAEEFEGRNVKNRSSILKSLGIAASVLIICGAALIIPRLFIGDGAHLINPPETVGPSSSLTEDYPAYEEIVAEYEKATNIDDMFAISISQLVGNVNTAIDEPLEYGGQYYFESKKYSSFDELRNELLTVFSEEITDELLDTELIMNVDGKLYAVLADGGDIAPIKVLNEPEIIPVTKDRLIVRVMVEITDYYLRNYESYASGEVIDSVYVDFPYEKIGDNWVFTVFPYIRSAYEDQLKGKCTEYEFDFGKLVLPSRYDGMVIFETNVGKYMLTVAYDPYRDGRYSEDAIFSFWRIPVGEEIPSKDGFLNPIAIGYDEEYVYMVTPGVSTARSVTYESGFDEFVTECIRAMRVYMPHINGWSYSKALEDNTKSMPTESEIMAEYETAKEIFSWFHVTTTDLLASSGGSSTAVEIDGSYYHKSARFARYDEFVNHLRTVFTEEKVQEFLTSGVVAELGGELYVGLRDRGSNINVGGITTSVIMVSEDEFILRRTVEILDSYLLNYPYGKFDIIDTVYFDMHYIREGDNWVFTDFQDIDTEYYAKLEEKYTEYESESCTIVLPSKYDDKVIVVADKTVSEKDKILFSIYYDPTGEGTYAVDDFIFQIGRMTYDEFAEIAGSAQDGFTTIGNDDEYYYTLLTATYVVGEPTEEYITFMEECRTAMLTYMPTENKWDYAWRVFMYEGYAMDGAKQFAASQIPSVIEQQRVLYTMQGGEAVEFPVEIKSAKVELLEYAAAYRSYSIYRYVGSYLPEDPSKIIVAAGEWELNEDGYYVDRRPSYLIFSNDVTPTLVGQMFCEFSPDGNSEMFYNDLNTWFTQLAFAEEFESYKKHEIVFDLNRGGESVTLSIKTPPSWEFGESTSPVIPFVDYTVIKKDGKVIGSIGAATFEITDGADVSVPEMVFSQLTMSAVSQWNIHGHFDRVVTVENESYHTAKTSVLYSSKMFEDGMERKNSAIVSYSESLQAYVAMELQDGTSGLVILNDAQLQYVAESIVLR